MPSYVGEFSQCITTNLAGCPDVMKTPLMTSYNQDAEYYESLIKHCTPSKITLNIVFKLCTYRSFIGYISFTGTIIYFQLLPLFIYYLLKHYFQDIYSSQNSFERRKKYTYTTVIGPRIERNSPWS